MSRRFRIEAGTVRVSGLGGLALVLERLGLSPGPLLDAACLPRTLFDNPDDLVAVGKAACLLDLAAEWADCPHLGLLCGESFRPDTLGVVGRLAQNAVDVGSGLRGLILNLHLHGHAFVPTMTVSSGTAELGLRLALELPGNTVPVIDLGMAASLMIVRALCGAGWAPLEVLLARRPVAHRDPYERFFGAPVRFDSDRDGIVFAAAWLGRRVCGADAGRRTLLERELAVIAQQQRVPAATMARRALLACITRGNISVEAVAAAVGLHSRTLNRRLAREGTSVFELTQQVRFQIARGLLSNTSLPVTEIAATLLYSDIGAFTRAFRRWAQQSPSHWRLSQGTKSDVQQPREATAARSVGSQMQLG